MSFKTNLLRPSDGHDSNRVGYIELFFDLVFVFAVTQLTHGLIAHPDLPTLGQTLMLGLAVWWAWNYTAWVTNWLDPERGAVRGMLIVLMLFGLLMASAIPEAFGDKALLFAGSLVAIQVGRTLFTVAAMWRHWPEIGQLRPHHHLACHGRPVLARRRPRPRAGAAMAVAGGHRD